MEVFVTLILYSFETDNGKRCTSCSCIRMGLVTYYIGLVMIYKKVLVTGILNVFAIIIETGVLGYGFVLGIL